MECDRYECENIMCSKMVLSGSMYICDTCYLELVNYRKTGEAWRDTMQSIEIKNLIAQFMDTPPGTYLEEVNTDEEFEKLTGNRDE